MWETHYNVDDSLVDNSLTFLVSVCICNFLFRFYSFAVIQLTCNKAENTICAIFFVWKYEIGKFMDIIFEMFAFDWLDWCLAIQSQLVLFFLMTISFTLYKNFMRQLYKLDRQERLCFYLLKKNWRYQHTRTHTHTLNRNLIEKIYIFDIVSICSIDSFFVC